MKLRNILSLFCLVSCALLIGCDDEKEFASILGQWQGTKAEAEIEAFGIPLPINETDDTFDAVVEFKDDGTIILTEDAQTSTGTWEQNGDKLLLSITFSTDFIDLSGTYTIKDLTATKLTLYIEKDGTYTDPDTGIDVDGTVKATLYFDKK